MTHNGDLEESRGSVPTEIVDPSHIHPNIQSSTIISPVFSNREQKQASHAALMNIMVANNDYESQISKKNMKNNSRYL